MGVLSTMMVEDRSRPSADMSFIRKARPGCEWEGTRRHESRNRRCSKVVWSGSKMSSSGLA